jgi:hypothetical protein
MAWPREASQARSSLTTLQILSIGYAQSTFPYEGALKVRTIQDYINARRIVNGLDRATEIATFATFWEGALSGINSIGSDPVPTTRLLLLESHLGELAGTEVDFRTNEGLEPSDNTKCSGN